MAWHIIAPSTDVNDSYTSAHYDERSRGQTNAQLTYIINDCHRALEAQGRDTDTPYTRRLWREIDAARSELSRRLPRR